MLPVVTIAQFLPSRKFGYKVTCFYCCCVMHVNILLAWQKVWKGDLGVEEFRAIFIALLLLSTGYLVIIHFLMTLYPFQPSLYTAFVTAIFCSLVHLFLSVWIALLGSLHHTWTVVVIVQRTASSVSVVVLKILQLVDDYISCWKWHACTKSDGRESQSLAVRARKESNRNLPIRDCYVSM